jgi:hypothetical protein
MVELFDWNIKNIFFLGTTIVRFLPLLIIASSSSHFFGPPIMCSILPIFGPLLLVAFFHFLFSFTKLDILEESYFGLTMAQKD